jgi:hypothetical protein
MTEPEPPDETGMKRFEIAVIVVIVITLIGLMISARVC